MKESMPKLRFPEFQDEWNESLLQESLEYVKSGKSTKSYDGLLPLYGSTGIIGNTDDSILEGAYILIARVGANAGQINLVQGKFGVSDNTLILSLKDKMNIYFLKEFLTQYNLNKLVYGTGQPLVTGGLLKKIKINIPQLPEQQKIATFLSAVDTKIQQLERKKDLLEQYKKGVMQQLFNQDVRFKQDDGSDYPDWEERKISELFTVTRGQVLSATKTKDNADREFKYPVYSSQTKNNGLMGFYNEFLFESAITWTTDGANAGDVNFREGKFYCTNVCGVLLSDKGYANQMIAEKLNTVTRCHVSYVGNPKLMNNVMASIKIKVPASIVEQTKIAHFLSAIDAKIALVNTQIEHTKTFKKGLLQQMFV